MYERSIEKAGCCGGLMARLWRLQSDTLGSSSAVAGFLLGSFSLSRLSSKETSMKMNYI